MPVVSHRDYILCSTMPLCEHDVTCGNGGACLGHIPGSMSQTGGTPLDVNVGGIS